MPLFKNWKPKTVAGKILKGATIGIGAVGLAATGVGAVAGVIGGTGLLAGAAAGVGTVVKAIGGGTKAVVSKVGGSALKLITGQSKEERQIIKEAKDEARIAKGKQDLMQKLQKLGLSQSEAASKAGILDTSVSGSVGGSPFKETMFPNLQGLLKPNVENQSNFAGTSLESVSKFALPAVVIGAILYALSKMK